MVTLGLEAETAHRWQQVRELTHTRDHWQWRKGWRPGRQSYWFFVCLDDEPTVADLAERYLAELDEPGLDPTAPERLHISVQQVGFDDEVSEHEASQVLHAARKLTVAPLALLLGSVDPNPESVNLRVAPWEPIRSLRRQLREATAGVIGSDRLPGTDDHFWPHVSIGYTNTELPTGPLLRRLEELSHRAPVSVLVRRIDLVLLNRDDRAWTWSTIGTVPLVPPSCQ
jgi:2'-5' RNA ligase